jgi:DNA-binding MarR family transcriptional regulator
MEHYTNTNFVLTETVGFKLVKARNLIVSELDAGLKEIGITSQQMSILYSMRLGAASTPFELSKRLGIDTGLMTRTLDKLEARGLLARSRSAGDRRVVNLTLTQRGEDLASRLPDIAPHVLNARLHHFTSEEFVELGRLLRKFIGE